MSIFNVIEKDFDTMDFGSVIMFLPLTEEARRVMDEEMALESWQMRGNGFVVDRRVAMDLIDALNENGLAV